MIALIDQVYAQTTFLRLLANITPGMVVPRVPGAKNVLQCVCSLGCTEKLISIANVAAGCGIAALFVTQDRARSKSVYGKGDTTSILTSCVTLARCPRDKANPETE